MSVDIERELIHRTRTDGFDIHGLKVPPATTYVHITDMGNLEISRVEHGDPSCTDVKKEMWNQVSLSREVVKLLMDKLKDHPWMA